MPAPVRTSSALAWYRRAVRPGTGSPKTRSTCSRISSGRAPSATTSSVAERARVTVASPRRLPRTPRFIVRAPVADVDRAGTSARELGRGPSRPSSAGRAATWDLAAWELRWWREGASAYSRVKLRARVLEARADRGPARDYAGGGAAAHSAWVGERFERASDDEDHAPEAAQRPKGKGETLRHVHHTGTLPNGPWR